MDFKYYCDRCTKEVEKISELNSWNIDINHQENRGINFHLCDRCCEKAYVKLLKWLRRKYEKLNKEIKE